MLIVELWGLGDLAIATPFLRGAAQRFAITLLAKPYALDLQPRLWPDVRVIPFVAPWTAFKNKYRLHRWPWRKIFQLKRQLAAEQFDFGLSARWDPRDHFLLALAGVKNRLGFPRMRSQFFLTEPLPRPMATAHRYEYWRSLGRALQLELPPLEMIFISPNHNGKEILLHSGAGQPVRVWPLERYARLAMKLRAQGYSVQIACDSNQRDWWLSAGENSVATPPTVERLIALIDRAGVFIGNDSGPGHLAAFCGVPTLTIFGPQLSEWFSPLHPASRCLDGKPCPYKPCSDYCRFLLPLCINNISEDEVLLEATRLAAQHIHRQ